MKQQRDDQTAGLLYLTQAGVKKMQEQLKRLESEDLPQAIRDVRTTAEFGAKVPADEAALRSLPGIGVYTSRAILAFAFDKPSVFLETNIRTVLLKHFFPGEERVPDRELERVASAVVDLDSPRRWYTALMDYGAEIKREEGNHSARGAGYRKQAPFATSFRRLRGAMVKNLVERKEIGIGELYASLPFSRENIEKCARILASEGFASYDGDSLKISR